MYKCIAAPTRGKRSRVKRADGETTSTEGTTVTVGSTVTSAEDTTTVTAPSETATGSTDITSATDGTTVTVGSTAGTSVDPITVTSASEAPEGSTEITAITEITTTPTGTETDEPISTVPDTPITAQPETTTATAEKPVETIEFQIVGTVTVETPQPIFENQWRMFAEKIQEKLEQHHVFFTGAVIVEMF
ncbi:hypothetical protein TELCIR_18819 [Teladorsagia circumcincta]|uniref:Uncharacterized protein n=1 Tax=Teladorsagia circumcincta TaxID=45464 RepID=A0A2G9TP85_TELCI|nr:hypothetical protein TELCIR_18819 [Teladorsagia circumcincta]